MRSYTQVDLFAIIDLFFMLLYYVFIPPPRLNSRHFVPSCSSLRERPLNSDKVSPLIKNGFYILVDTCSHYQFCFALQMRQAAFH